MVYMTALIHTLIGMGMVFLVLIFISLIISLFVHVPRIQRIWRRAGNRFRDMFAGSKNVIPEVKIFKRPPLPASFTQKRTKKEPEKDPGTDPVLIAVIMAAIAASEGGAVSADQLVVRKIRRIHRR